MAVNVVMAAMAGLFVHTTTLLLSDHYILYVIKPEELYILSCEKGPFAVPARRTQRIWDGNAWPKFEVFNFFRNDREGLDFLNSRVGYNARARGAQPQKPYHPS